MYSLTTATLEGYVTQEPVLKKTKTGKSLSTFAIAVRHYSQNEEDAKVSFIDIECWGNFAEMTAEKVKKGTRMMVFGQLRQDRWEGSDGKTKSKIKIVADQIRFLKNISSKNQDSEQHQNINREVAEAV